MSQLKRFIYKQCFSSTGSVRGAPGQSATPYFRGPCDLVSQLRHAPVMDFVPVKAADVRDELSLTKKDRNNRNKKNAMRSIIQNVTMSNLDMLNVFDEVIKCMQVDDLELKKMCYLYLQSYATAKPEGAERALEYVLKDIHHAPPVTSAMAFRTLSSISLKSYVKVCIDLCKKLATCENPYIRKTTAMAIAKTWSDDPKLTESSGLLRVLNHMLADRNPTVVASAVSALTEITAYSSKLIFRVSDAAARNMVEIIHDCNEWCQVYILSALLHWVPQSHKEAENTFMQILPRVQHENTAVVFAVARCSLYLLNYIEDSDRLLQTFFKKLHTSLLLLLSKPPELQHVVLRNCIILIQSRPDAMTLDIRPFFCKTSDPTYIKTSKIEILYLLSTIENVSAVIDDISGVAANVADLEASQRAIPFIARIALKFDSKRVTNLCIDKLIKLLSSKSPHLVQACMTSIQPIFKAYGEYKHLVPQFCEHQATIFENTDAKLAYIWMIGEYPTDVLDAVSILSDLVDSFALLDSKLQQVLLTVCIRYFLAAPSQGRAIVPRVFEVATETAENPDIRDRAFMYWRLLSTDPTRTKQIVLGPQPRQSLEELAIPRETLDALESTLGFISSIYLRSPTRMFRLSKPVKLGQSPALVPKHKLSDLLSEKSHSIAPAPVSPIDRDPSLQRAHSVLLTKTRPKPRTQGQLETPTESDGEDPKLVDI